MSFDFKSFFQGFKGILPLSVGVFPFAVVTGLQSIEHGLSLGQALGFSAFVFAGSSQLAALELLGHNAPVFVVVLTAWIINMRFLMYSASLKYELKLKSRPLKLALSHIITDQSFATSSLYFQKEKDLSLRVSYYLGASLTLWVLWVVGTALGLIFQKSVDPDWGLDFMVPLCFIAVLAPQLKNKAFVTSALTAGLGSLILFHMPLRLGLFISILLGIVAGKLMERKL